MPTPTPPKVAFDPAAAPLLQASGVAKAYDGTPALNGVNIAVRPGELVVLLGPNGAGKSTLLQLVTGLFTPDRGSISICGHDLRTGIVPALAQLGVVFQQPTLDLELSVEANLRFHAELHGLPGNQVRARIAAAAERFGLTDRLHSPARELSGGNRRRVELARALLHEPRLLVMDEATVGLDPASRRDILTHILSLRASGMGILWTTHLVDEAAMGDAIVVLNRGNVVFEGAPAELAARSQPADLGNAFLRLTTAADAAA